MRHFRYHFISDGPMIKEVEYIALMGQRCI